VSKRTLAVIELGRGREAAFKELADSGEFTILVVTRMALPEALAQYVDHVLTVETNDVDATITALRSYSASDRIDGALTLLEWYVPVVEAVRESLGLPGNGVAAAQRCRDKKIMRDTLRDDGIPVPRYRRIVDFADALGAAKAVGGFPCVVKPTDGTGSTNVVLVSTPAELRTAVERIGLATQNTRGQQLSRAAMIEQFVDGPEFAVDSLSIDGVHRTIAIQEYTMSPLPHFAETGFVTPPSLDPPGRAAVVDLAMRALDALGIVSGPSHCEIKWGAEGAVVIEAAARYGGAYIPEVIVHAAFITTWRVPGSLAEWASYLSRRSVPPELFSMSMPTRTGRSSRLAALRKPGPNPAASPSMSTMQGGT